MVSEPGLPTLDQLRVFLTVVNVGTFAGAARKLNRATSVISYTVANLKAQLGVREGRKGVVRAEPRRSAETVQIGQRKLRPKRSCGIGALRAPTNSFERNAQASAAPRE